MLRQHYALILQNRLVQLELNFRYFALSGKRLEAHDLTDPQKLALRFAPDDELLTLVERASREKLSPDKIKKSIINWLPDQHRV